MQESGSSAKRIGPRTVLVYAAWAALVAPVTIVLHELGHYGIGLALGTPDLALHFGSVSDSAAESGFPASKVGVQALAGPVATLIIMAVSVFGLRAQPNHPIWIAALFAAPIRFTVGAVYLYFLAAAAVQGIPPGQPNFDEFKAAQALGFAVEPLLIAELVLTLALWAWAVARMNGAIRLRALTGTWVGIVAGIGLWITTLGPMLLP